MIKKRRGSAKAAFGQQEAAFRRRAPGKKFVGEDAGAAQGRAAELAKVHELQMAAREGSQRVAQEESGRAHDELLSRPWWEAVGGLVIESARLASTLAWLPVRMAKLPLRVAASLVPRLRAAV